MRLAKTVLLLAVLLSLPSFAGQSGKKKETKKADTYIPLHKESKLKKYNPDAEWKHVKCKHCNGTGHKVMQKFDAKKNRMIKWLVPCPYCKGKGTKGMSKL